MEQAIFSERIQVERKIFSVDLRENPRGRFLKITEDVGGRRDAIIIPASGLSDLRKVLDRVLQACDDAPAMEAVPTEPVSSVAK